MIEVTHTYKHTHTLTIHTTNTHTHVLQGQYALEQIMAWTMSIAIGIAMGSLGTGFNLCIDALTRCRYFEDHTLDTCALKKQTDDPSLPTTRSHQSIACIISSLIPRVSSQITHINVCRVRYDSTTKFVYPGGTWWKPWLVNIAFATLYSLVAGFLGSYFSPQAGGRCVSVSLFMCVCALCLSQPSS